MNLQALQLALENNLGNRLTPELAAGIYQASLQTIPNRIDLNQIEAIQYSDYDIQCEYIEDVLPELMPLHQEHWTETEGYRHQVQLNPDYDYMVNSEQQGRFLLFTVRCDEGMVGNCMMYLTQSTHTRKWIAEEDTIFISAPHRKGRVGIKLIQYVERVLGALGITEIRVTVKTINRVGDLLQALGYQHTANQLIKVLGEAHVQ